MGARAIVCFQCGHEGHRQRDCPHMEYGFAELCGSVGTSRQERKKEEISYYLGNGREKVLEGSSGHSFCLFVNQVGATEAPLIASQI